MGAADAALRLLGLAARAGALLPGTERVREAARSGAVHFVIVAADTSENSNDKLLPLLARRGVPHAVAFTREQLGAAVGHAPLSAVGITQKHLADQVSARLATAESADDVGGT